MDGKKVKLRLEHISQSYIVKNEVSDAVVDVSLDVYDNEFLVILGPGRCGKTVLLNMIAGLEKPVDGSLFLDGEEIHGSDERIGMVFQKLALMPWKTVMENVEFGLKMKGVPKAQRRETAQKYINLVGLQGFEKSYPSQLSGGMKQRAGIARAYTNNPEIMLMDEPFGQLDAQTRYSMQDEVLRIWESEKRTFIFVTNNIEEALYLADRIVLLTNYPAQVKEIYDINLPRPRDTVSPEFLRLRKIISDNTDLALCRRWLRMSEPKSEYKVEVKNLTKYFGDLHVLNDISFNVRKGEFICIVGPTGCGKTTFLNLLTRIYMPSKGDLLIDGESADPKKHNLAFVFQEPSSIPWKTVEENLRFGLELKKLPKKEIDERVENIIKLMGLQNFRDAYPHQLSVSTEQRIIIGRAFAMNPDLLLMDEPYGQMDIKLRFYLEDEVVRLWKETGSTVLFITHNIEEAVYLAERILILSNKPTTIKEDFKVDLPRPRDVTSPEFTKIRQYVTDQIKWW